MSANRVSYDSDRAQDYNLNPQFRLLEKAV